MGLTKIQKTFENRDYITSSQLITYFGLNETNNRKKFHEIIEKLYESNVCYQDENGDVCPLVEMRQSKGRFPKYFAIKNSDHCLKLMARIIQENGVDVYCFREGVYPLELREKMKHQFGLGKLHQKLEELYRLKEQFVDENGIIQDLVLQNKKETAYFLHPSETAFKIFKEKMQKLANIPVLSPAKVAVKLGYHKGFGTCLETQLAKMYRQNYVYFDEKGESFPLIRKYIIEGKERFFLSSHPHAFEVFKDIYTEAKTVISLTPGLEKLKQENQKAFYDELYSAYQEGILFQNESGKSYPLVEMRASISKGYRLVIAPNSNAYKLFSDRLKKRIKEYNLSKQCLGITALASKLKLSNQHVFCLREVLKMLHDENISYMDSSKKVRPLVLKKNDKYYLFGDKESLKMFGAHLRTFVCSYGEKPKNYLSFEKVSSLIDEKITRTQFCTLLDEMQKEGAVVLNQDGNVSLAVQRFRLKNNVMPFLSNSVNAIQLLRHKLSLHER